MTTVTTTDILRHPALLNATDGITLIEDGRRHEPKSDYLYRDTEDGEWRDDDRDG